MAIGFGTTSGTGATDRITTNLTTNNVTLSMAFKFKTTFATETDGRLYDKGNNTVTNGDFLSINTTSIRLFKTFTVGLTGAKQASIPYTPDNEWHTVVVTHDRSSINNTPIFYLDGSIKTLNSNTTQQGSFAGTTNPFILGNRPASANLVFPGILAGAAFWNRLLSADEALSMSAAFSPLIGRRGLFYYNPMIRGHQNLAGSTTHTVTGTVIQPHPRLLLPYG